MRPLLGKSAGRAEILFLTAVRVYVQCICGQWGSRPQARVVGSCSHLAQEDQRSAAGPGGNALAFTPHSNSNFIAHECSCLCLCSAIKQLSSRVPRRSHAAIAPLSAAPRTLEAPAHHFTAPPLRPRLSDLLLSRLGLSSPPIPNPHATAHDECASSQPPTRCYRPQRAPQVKSSQATDLI